MIKTQQDFKNAALSRTKGDYHTWLESQEGSSAFDRFLTARFDTFQKQGITYRALNLIIMSDKIQTKSLISGKYSTSPWLLLLSCDYQEWADFENKYFQYYLMCRDELV